MMTDTSLIVGVKEDDPRAWVPLADYELCRRKMLRFRNALNAIVAVFDTLTDDEQRDVLHEPAPAPLDDKEST